MHRVGQLQGMLGHTDSTPPLCTTLPHHVPLALPNDHEALTPDRLDRLTLLLGQVVITGVLHSERIRILRGELLKHPAAKLVARISCDCLAIPAS